MLIDLDNTINDRAGAFAAWAEEACGRAGLDRSAVDWMVEIDADGYGDRTAILTAIFERLGRSGPLEELAADYRRAIRRHLREVPGARRCLAELRAAGHTVVILTNGSADAQHHKIDVLGFRDLVDGVVVSGEVGVAKPDPAIFRLAAEAVARSLEGAWMVGDSAHHDIAGARALGLATAWIDRGRRWDDATPPPTVTIGHLDQLAPAIAATSPT